MQQDGDILSHQFRGRQGGGTSTHVALCPFSISYCTLTFRLQYIASPHTQIHAPISQLLHPNPQKIHS